MRLSSSTKPVLSADQATFHYVLSCTSNCRNVSQFYGYIRKCCWLKEPFAHSVCWERSRTFFISVRFIYFCCFVSFLFGVFCCCWFFLGGCCFLLVGVSFALSHASRECLRGTWPSEIFLNFENLTLNGAIWWAIVSKKSWKNWGPQASQFPCFPWVFCKISWLLSQLLMCQP